jgi:hypothetical protein
MRRATQAALLGSGLLGGALLIAHRASAPDPRGADQVARLVRRSERDDFLERLRRGNEVVLTWPGLAAAQVSWAWLEMLYGISKKESYEGDFSWIYSKLNTILSVANKNEIYFLAGIAPFYFVIGHDHAGATLLADTLVRRAPKSWQAWFWSGMHALENLGSRRLAGDQISRAGAIEGSPAYFKVLGNHLSGGGAVSREESRRIMDQYIDPNLKQKVQSSREKSTQ